MYQFPHVRIFKGIFTVSRERDEHTGILNRIKISDFELNTKPETFWILFASDRVLADMQGKMITVKVSRAHPSVHSPPPQPDALFCLRALA